MGVTHVGRGVVVSVRVGEKEERGYEHSTGNKVHLEVTQVSQKVYPFPSKKCLLRRLHLAKFIATSLHRNNNFPAFWNLS